MSAITNGGGVLKSFVEKSFVSVAALAVMALVCLVFAAGSPVRAYASESETVGTDISSLGGGQLSFSPSLTGRGTCSPASTQREKRSARKTRTETSRTVSPCGSPSTPGILSNPARKSSCRS